MKKPLRRDMLKLAGVGAASAMSPGLLSACKSDESALAATRKMRNANADSGLPPTEGGDATVVRSPADFDKNEPFWRQGNFAPISEESEALDLQVWGALPPELNRYSYGMRYDGLGADYAVPAASAVVKYDMSSGERRTIEFDPAVIPDERVFVPASAGAGEDQGYLLGFAYDAARNASDFLVHDASTMSDEPVARVELPYRVPCGFHGLWVPA